jgi:mRNA interferase HigB
VHPDSQVPLTRWYKVVRLAEWQNFAEVKQQFGSVDAYHRCVIFNLGGNKFRLIAAIHYNTQIVYVRNVLTHADYDREDWKDGCRP